MRPQLVKTLGSRTVVEVWGGYREIGGNCVVVRDGDRKIVFDNGLRFSVLRAYFAGSIAPTGPLELMSLGAIPPMEVYEDADAVYVSHFHLDHLGLLKALPPGMKVKVPSLDVHDLLYKRYNNSPTWLSSLPAGEGVELVEARPGVEDELGVTAFPVSHSAYPSLAFLYRGSEATIFYSGDFRLKPLYILGPTVKSYSDEVAGADAAVVEGTNIGGEDPSLLGPDDFSNIFLGVLEQCRRLVVVSIDWSDLEAFLAVSRLASQVYPSRRVVVGTERLLEYLALMSDRVEPLRGVEFYYLEELELKEIPPLGLEPVSFKEIIREPGGYVVVQEPADLLEVLRKTSTWEDVDLSGSFVILTDPEPRETPAEVEEAVLRRWLSEFGFIVARLRVSGHYSPVDSWEVAKFLRPKSLIPIHTKDPVLMERIFKSAI